MSDPLTPREKPPVSVWRRAMLGLAGVIALTALAGFLATRYEQARILGALQALTDRLDEDDPHWRLAEFESRREAIPEDENSVRVVAAVAAALPTRWTPDGILDPLPEPNLLLAPGPAAALEKEMTLVAHPLTHPLAQARRLAEMPRGRFHINYPFNTLGTAMPEVEQSRQVSMLLRFDLLHLAQQGDLDAALRSGRASINAARAVSEEPCPMAQLIRCTNLISACGMIERGLALGEASEPELAALQRLLEQEGQHPTQRLAVRGERAMRFDLFDKLASGALTQEQMLREFAVAPLPWWRGWFDSRVTRRDQIAELKLLNESVASTDLPGIAQSALHSRLDGESRMRKVCPRLAGLLHSELALAAEVIRQKIACVRCLLVAVALERYRLEHGKWPETLNPLTPKYLAEVPLDPGDHKPLRFAKWADGVVIYAIGKNGTDDGGKVWPRQAADEGYRLWDVNKRRQPARAAPGEIPP